MHGLAGHFSCSLPLMQDWLPECGGKEIRRRDRSKTTPHAADTSNFRSLVASSALTYVSVLDSRIWSSDDKGTSYFGQYNHSAGLRMPQGLRILGPIHFTARTPFVPPTASKISCRHLMSANFDALPGSTCVLNMPN